MQSLKATVPDRIRAVKWSVKKLYWEVKDRAQIVHVVPKRPWMPPKAIVRSHGWEMGGANIIDIWCKWGVKELRTTNLAEAFHRRLGVLTGVDHPPLSVLIDVLKKLTYEARAALKRLKDDPENAVASAREQRERRDQIWEEMAKFDEVYQEGPSPDQIVSYCRRMSKYITNKSI